MTSQPQRVQVLDCTLRDGGYYNAWDFAPELVDDYLAAMGAAGVDVVEIGFRSYPKATFLGPYAYATDDFLATLKLPAGTTVGVMVNAADLLGHGDDPAAAVDGLFRPAADSPVSLVRIAAHLGEVPRCHAMLDRLRQLGYRTGLNLMQVSRADDALLGELAAGTEAAGSTEVLYFADSLGNMTPVDIRRVHDALRQAWSGPIGIHAHDNRGRALTNTLEAFEYGATWLDATVLGMGRGAGNVRTDFLLFELGQAGVEGYRPDALLPLGRDGFQVLHDRYRWGTNLLYLMSAAYDIHPTYVQMMLSDGRYDTTDIPAALRALRDMEGHSYRADRLVQAMEGDGGDRTGAWDATGWCAGRDVLVLGTGPSAQQHRDELTRYILREQPVVLCLNSAAPVPDDLVTAYVACNPSRLMLEAGRFAGLHRPLIAPETLVRSLVGEELADVERRDYGLAVEPGRFEADATGCVLPARLAVAYAFAVAVTGGARRLLLAGFDGYPAGDPRQEEMVDLLRAYEESDGVPLLALTPTTYPVPQGSVYAPG